MKNIYTNEYYQKVRELFPEINFKEGRFLHDIKKILTDYEKTHPKCTYEDLVQEFESPEEVVYNYITVEGKNYLFNALHRRKYGKYVSICAITVMLMLGITIIGILLDIHLRTEKNFPVIKETVITVVKERYED